jgi:CRP-like cAMP-binding protein
LTTPQTAQLIAPLFEPDLSSRDLLRYSEEAWDMQHLNATDIIRQLITESDSPWQQAIVTFSLGEMGAALSSRETAGDDAQKPEEQKRQKRRRPRPGDLLDLLSDDSGSTPSPQPEEAVPDSEQTMPTRESLSPFTLAEIEDLLKNSSADSADMVQQAARTASRMLTGGSVTEVLQEDIVLSTIEKIIFLKEVSFFQSMTIDQLRVLANVCEEEFFEEDVNIFNQGDLGGVMYVVVNGRVGIEKEGLRKRSVVRLATIESNSYFGEMTLFDNSPRSASAIALQDTLTLRLRREPLIALARQYPDLSLELINVLSARLRDTNNQLAKLTRSKPRELQKLYDVLE